MKQVLMLRILGAVVLLGLAGCSRTVGPRVLSGSQIPYNQAVHQVVSEELLLNIVRRRYFEAPQFVSIASITTQVSNSASAGVGGSGQWTSGGGAGVPNSTSSVSGNLGWSYADSPTISIVPRADEEVTKKLTQRIFYDTPGYLANVGYPYDLVFALTVEAAGNVRGPSFGIESGGIDSFKPGSREYVEAVRRMRSLIDKGKLFAGTILLNDPYADITYPKASITPERQMTAVALGTGMGRYRSFDGGDNYYFTDQNYYSFLWIEEDARDTEDGRRLIELLNVNREPYRRLWKIEGSRVPTGPQFYWQTKDPSPEDSLYLWPRSFYSVLNFLAFAVEVPEEEVADGRAFSTASYERAVESGLAVDLTKYLTIHSSEKRPSDAFVAIFHRGKWFYIDDRDANSKRFFNAVNDLFNIEIAPSGPSAGPALTLPLR